ncbi:hypothetical protein C7R88_03675 [Plesiomonas shigelloides]|uniref:hypothetical protein n=1 Tax=Plesiomonas shigelloides TaxID=703 RepID=UPI000D136DB2|nr:hypothetical protein [Plesiomonas shigelloides]AVQ86491.1 hypothetical protein C7R88_03675 [Plesiomonas shigelloides]
MCILCGNDVSTSELMIHQETINRLEYELKSEITKSSQLEEKLQQLEYQLIETERNNSEQYCNDTSLNKEVLNNVDFFCLVKTLVEFGFSDNPFYTYKKDTYELIELSDEEVIKLVESNAKDAIAKIEIDGRLESLNFIRNRKMIDDNGKRYIQIGFEATYEKLLPCELYVLMKAGENTYSDTVHVDNNEIHMYENNNWLLLFYHSTNIDYSVSISLTFNYYADDSGVYTAGREHAIRFLHKAANSALMQRWISV